MHEKAASRPVLHTAGRHGILPGFRDAVVPDQLALALPIVDLGPLVRLPQLLLRLGRR